MFRGHRSRCLISTSVSPRSDGTSVSRTISSNRSVPNGLRKQIRVTGGLRSVGVSAVVVGWNRGLLRPFGKAVGREGFQQAVAAEPRNLACEQLGGKRREQDASSTPAVEGVCAAYARILADQRALVRR